MRIRILEKKQIGLYSNNNNNNKTQIDSLLRLSCFDAF